MALDFHRIYILLDTGLLHFGLSNLLDFKAAWNAVGQSWYVLQSTLQPNLTLLEQEATHEQKLEAELADATKRALHAHELLQKTRDKLKALCLTQLQCFSCGICTFTLQNPHALKCGHIYCEDCIMKYLDFQLLKRTKKVGCPTCRREVGPDRPAALLLLKENIEQMVKDGDLNPKDVFTEVDPEKSLDWNKLERHRRLQFPVRIEVTSIFYLIIVEGSTKMVRSATFGLGDFTL
ncbi:hypothetical protein BT96DRAFT_948746 [Gymnopus androsaceus JB14]|uniref:RING-type domain-containing protein n=1 Tax=Gymnopus androsaceus JB14 TaxID=1447944 RepID=A0A6A4GNY6_9AGAR|nr:hypothetical protein BT96DRAFT_948746 [Gymnopus androsaceus JB14]